MENIAADYAGSDYQLHIDRINRIKGLFNSCYYDAVEEKESALPERETNRPWWRFWR
jgi:L-rhamnose mutarotase